MIIVNGIDVFNLLQVLTITCAVLSVDALFTIIISQVRFAVTFCAAKWVNGAGLTNMLFMPHNSSILEFHKQQTNAKDFHSLIFWYMADGLGHKYYHQVSEPANPNDDFFTADFTVNISSLKSNLKLMFPDDKVEY